jgi:tetrahydromethanopterin S-methyltransferase subunit H
MLDVVAETPEAMQNYLRYLVDVVESPLLIDGSSDMTVNLAGLKVANEGGFLDRVVLNSLTPEVGEDDYRRVQELGLANALILAHSTAAITSATKRIEIAQTLSEKAMNAGISNLLFDTGVLDLPTLGLACKAIRGIKDALGFPSGCGAHNAVSTWKGLKTKFGKEAKIPAFVGSSLMPVALGADFILYGPIKHAPVVFPSVAMIDVALSGIFLESRTRIPKPHPRYSIG